MHKTACPRPVCGSREGSQGPGTEPRVAEESSHVKGTQKEDPRDKGNHQGKEVLPYDPGGKGKVPESECRFCP